MPSPDRLRRTVATFARHAAPGGLVLVEPWFAPGDWQDGRVTADLTEYEGTTLARMVRSGQDGTVSTLDLHWLVSRPGTAEIEYLTERHELGLFTAAEYRAAFEAAGLTVEHNPVGLTGRGLFVGVRSG